MSAVFAAGGNGVQRTLRRRMAITYNDLFLDIRRELKRGGVIGEVMTPTKPGAVFGGWYADQALTKPWDIQKDPVRSNMTLYARWM